MAHRKEQLLAKIGQEGFDLIDGIRGKRKGRPSPPQRPNNQAPYIHYPQQSHIVKLHPSEAKWYKLTVMKLSICIKVLNISHLRQNHQLLLWLFNYLLASGYLASS